MNGNGNKHSDTKKKNGKTFHAKSVEACWRIATQEAAMYQRRMSGRKLNDHARAMCKVGRDAADRIALRIRFGRLIHPSKS